MSDATHMTDVEQDPFSSPQFSERGSVEGDSSPMSGIEETSDLEVEDEYVGHSIFTLFRISSYLDGIGTIP